MNASTGRINKDFSRSSSVEHILRRGIIDSVCSYSRVEGVVLCLGAPGSCFRLMLRCFLQGCTCTSVRLSKKIVRQVRFFTTTMMNSRALRIEPWITISHHYVCNSNLHCNIKISRCYFFSKNRHITLGRKSKVLWPFVTLLFILYIPPFMLFFNIENQENYLVPSVIKKARIKVSKVKNDS